MIYNDFKGEKLSCLGFGMMRLPCLEDGSVDREKTEEMVHIAMRQGVNYYDTAYPYHGGMSEKLAGELLSKYPRDSYYLADKYPGHQIQKVYEPARIFEEQLQRCGVDYFDFYLLHNVYEHSFDVYCDPRWGIVDYFVEQRRSGRIRHLGISSHSKPDNLRAFLERYGDVIEFCQIQLNYLDWTLQDAKAKVEILREFHIPIWVMEPLRGGRLCRLDAEDAARLRSQRPFDGNASWALRWLLRIPEVTVILSGMSDPSQMYDNLKTFSTKDGKTALEGDSAAQRQGAALSDSEAEQLLSMAERMKNSIPCTSCRYCCDACPQHLDIPSFISAANDIRFGDEGAQTASMQMEFLPAGQRPQDCRQCGACSEMCPQNIPVPQVIRELNQALRRLPKWTDICRQRNETAERNKGLL